jgi:hypothetical protein
MSAQWRELQAKRQQQSPQALQASQSQHAAPAPIVAPPREPSPEIEGDFCIIACAIKFILASIDLLQFFK